jgi:hypothetical protein
MNAQGSAELAWSIPVAVADIPETGRRIELAPDAATLTQIADAIGLVALPRLEVAADLSPYGHDGLRVDGRVPATI